MKFAKEGMWGKGIYFAKNAGYSNDYYPHIHEDGNRGIFLACVVLGQTKYMNPQKDLIQPPPGFDSVSGNTRGSDVYIIYANKKAYPQFYVKYEIIE